MRTILVFFLYFGLLHSTIAQSVETITVYPKKDFHQLIYKPQFDYLLHDNTRGYVQIQHNNNLNELSDIYYSRLFGVTALGKQSTLGFEATLEKEGPFIGRYFPKVFYVKEIQINRQSSFTLTGGIGFRYEKFAVGVQINKAFNPDGFMQFNTHIKNSHILFRINQLFDQKSLMANYTFQYPRFLSIAYLKDIHLSKKYVLSPRIEYQLLPQQLDYFAFLLRLDYSKALFVLIGYNQLHEIPIGVGATILKNGKNTIDCAFNYTKNTAALQNGVKLDRIELSIYLKR